MYGLALFASAVLAATAPVGGSTQSQADIIRIPVAPPHIRIVIEGEDEQPWVEPQTEPENEILLRVPQGTAYFRGQIPANVEESIQVLRLALPQDYLQLLMENWNYERIDGRRVQPPRRDLRLVDLAHFLFEQWVYDKPEGQLAKEFDCLSWGEESIEPFLILLTQAEAHSYDSDRERYRLRPEFQDAKLDIGSARLLLHRCKQLIERGAGPEDL